MRRALGSWIDHSRLCLAGVGLLFVAAIATGAGLTGALSASSAAASATYTMPEIRHVFVIFLENEGYASTFGEPASDPYLASTLPAQGALLQDYYATGHVSNDNYISFVSGQPPNTDNQGDCPVFDNFPPEPTPSSNGVEGGAGCVYPTTVENIGTQLDNHAGMTWKAYQEDMGNKPGREAPACGHPTINSKDETQTAVEGDGYATRHDPFVYFHSVIDNQSFCENHVVAMGSPSGALPPGALPGESGLATDLASSATTPNFSFITPNLCNDGHDSPCKNQAGGASALANIDAFLETWVPKITSSQAFRENGLLEIAFDEAATSDASSCCGETPGPGSPEPGIGGAGGGKVGAVLLSPFIKPGTVSTTPYNHYSSLASFETLFGLSRLADAASVTTTFGADVFTAPAGQPATTTAPSGAGGPETGTTPAGSKPAGSKPANGKRGLAPRRCQSRRVVRIVLPHHGGSRAVEVVAFVNHKKVKTVRGRSLRSITLSFKGHRAGPATTSLRVSLRRGGHTLTRTVVHHYRLCASGRH